MQPNQLPVDIHNNIMSPQTSFSAKAQLTNKFSNTQMSQTRIIQTIGREPTQKLRTQRSTSRGQDLIRGIRTDLREDQEGHNYSRPESRGPSQDDRKESHRTDQEAGGKFDGTMKFGKQQLSGLTHRQNPLRDSHDSMRSIQKQRIQRSLQKSQEGRRKLEEKLESLQSQRYAQNISSMSAHQQFKFEESSHHDPSQEYRQSQNRPESRPESRQESEHLTIDNTSDMPKRKFDHLSQRGAVALRGGGHNQTAVIEDNSFRDSHYQSFSHYRPQVTSSLSQSHYKPEVDAAYQSVTSATSGRQAATGTKKTSTQSIGSISNQIHAINQQLPKQVCNNIEEAQPFLRGCLVAAPSSATLSVANESGNFSALLSSGHTAAEPELDKNLICPKCHHIVVFPVECQECQYIICFKCAKQTSMLCTEEECGNTFTSTPGKIHKLYREMLNSLEFRCPNTTFGCSENLKYDQIDNHLLRRCEAKLMPCPNQCSRSKKFTQKELKKHMEEECPKECIPCPQCKQIKYRMEIEDHLRNNCDKVLIQCPHCKVEEPRGVFKRNKHECAASEDQPQSFSRKASQYSGEQRPRNYEDFTNRKTSTDTAPFDSDRKTEGEQPVTQAQVSEIKKDLQDVNNLIVKELFQMVENMSQAIQEKDGEILEVKKQCKIMESDLQHLEKATKAKDKELVQTQVFNKKLQQQANEAQARSEEMIGNLQARSAAQADRMEDIQTKMADFLVSQQAKFEEQTEAQRQLLIQLQAAQSSNRSLEERLEAVEERSSRDIARLEEKLVGITSNHQAQLMSKDVKIATLEKQMKNLQKQVDTLAKDSEAAQGNLDAVIAESIQKLNANITFIRDNQVRAEDQAAQFKAIVIDKFKEQDEVLQRQEEARMRAVQIEKLKEQQQKAPEQPEPNPKQEQPSQSLLAKVRQHMQEEASNLKGSDQNSKLQESNVSESLDEEIYQEHFQREQEKQIAKAQPQHRLLVPPIDLGAKKGPVRTRKSPDSRKVFEEDDDEPQPAVVPEDQKVSFYMNPLDNSGSLTEPAAEEMGSRAKHPLPDDSLPQAKKVGNYVSEDYIEIDDDIDESNFIPAYLSGTETDLNQTELNTEFNTARPLNQAFGSGDTDRGSLSNNYQSKLSARDQERRNDSIKRQPALQEESGGLTDRAAKPKTVHPQTDPSQNPMSSDQVSMSLTSLSQTMNTNYRSNTLLSNSKLEETPLERSEGCQGIEESSPVICSNIPMVPAENAPELKPASPPKELVVVKETTSDNIDRASNEDEARVEDYDPITGKLYPPEPLPSQPNRQGVVVQEEEEQKKSIPYNETMTKTFESSEFELSQSAALPGMIFGGQSTKLLKAEIPEQIPEEDTSESKHEQVFSPATPASEDDLSKYYALANKRDSAEKMERVPSGGKPSNITTTQSRKHVPSRITSEFATNSAMRIENQISETEVRKPRDEEPYLPEGTPQMTQTLKLNKSKEVIEQFGEDYEKIKSDIENLSKHYKKEGANEGTIQRSGKSHFLEDILGSAQRTDPMDTTADRIIKAVTRPMTTDERFNQVMKDLETSGKTESSELRVTAFVGKQERDDESLEREDASNNLDNLIEDVLDGKALFAKQNKEVEEEQEVSKQEVREEETKEDSPFEVSKQEPGCSILREQVGSLNKKTTAERAKVDDQGSSSSSDFDAEPAEAHYSRNRRSLPAEIPIESLDGESPQKVEIPPPVVPSGLESDLETILETDQESNYMTTARMSQKTAAKQSARGGGPLPPSNGPSAQLGAPQQQPALNQTINSMNSSFFMGDNSNMLPQNIYQNNSFAEDEVAESMPIQAIDAVQVNAFISRQKEMEMPASLFGGAAEPEKQEPSPKKEMSAKPSDEPRKSQNLGLSKEESEVSEIHQELPERLFPQPSSTASATGIPGGPLAQVEKPEMVHPTIEEIRERFRAVGLEQIKQSSGSQEDDPNNQTLFQSQRDVAEYLLQQPDLLENSIGDKSQLKRLLLDVSPISNAVYDGNMFSGKTNILDSVKTTELAESLKQHCRKLGGEQIPEETSEASSISPEKQSIDIDVPSYLQSRKDSLLNPYKLAHKQKALMEHQAQLNSEQVTAPTGDQERTVEGGRSAAHSSKIPPLRSPESTPLASEATTSNAASTFTSVESSAKQSNLKDYLQVVRLALQDSAKKRLNEQKQIEQEIKKAQMFSTGVPNEEGASDIPEVMDNRAMYQRNLERKLQSVDSIMATYEEKKETPAGSPSKMGQPTAEEADPANEDSYMNE